MTNLEAGILIFCTCDEMILVYEKSVECGYQVVKTTFCLNNGPNLYYFHY